MTSRKRTARTGHAKKYVPSVEQRAADSALTKNLDQISAADVRAFDAALERILDSETDEEDARKRWSKGASRRDK